MASQQDSLINSAPAPWRLIISPASSAAFNMALDEALLSNVSQKKALPTLRLYSWLKPSLSLGYAQPVSDVNLEKLAAHDWQLVRRPTGGKAILHTDELTYSITAPLDEPLVAGTLLESYQRISFALQKALQSLGTQVFAKSEHKLPDTHAKNEPVCFQTPSDYEITWKDKKIIGSAQARKLGGVLQHGSLPLYGDLSRITQVLQYHSELERESAAQKTLAQATTLEIATGKLITWEAAAQAITQSFTSELNICFTTDHPIQNEIDLANILIQTKYGSDSWNLRI